MPVEARRRRKRASTQLLGVDALGFTKAGEFQVLNKLELTVTICNMQSKLSDTDAYFFDYRDECERQVKGFSGAVYKKFATRALAEAFVVDRKDLEDRSPGIEAEVSPGPARSTHVCVYL